MTKETWKLDPTFRQKFLDACRLAATNDEAFANFKQDSHIGCVVENSTQEWVNQVVNDTHYQPLENETPNDYRYRYTLYVMAELFVSDFSGWRITEIGGGYGGMCKRICQSCYPESYTIYDLEEPSMLQRRYLKDLKASLTFINNPYPPSKLQDLCIAWCSWSELDIQTAKAYIENVMLHCSHLFISINWDYEINSAILLKYFPDLKVHEDKHLGKIIFL